jgi:hypothetical protein
MVLFTLLTLLRVGDVMTAQKKKQILARNRRIDSEKLNQVLRILRKRRQEGSFPVGYKLDIPFAHRIHARHERG